MIPILKRKEAAQPSLTIKTRIPDTKPEGQEADSMHSAAQDIMSAIETKDIKKLAVALQAAFEIADSKPHEEGPHLNSEIEE